MTLRGILFEIIFAGRSLVRTNPKYTNQVPGFFKRAARSLAQQVCDLLAQKCRYVAPRAVVTQALLSPFRGFKHNCLHKRSMTRLPSVSTAITVIEAVQSNPFLPLLSDTYPAV